MFFNKPKNISACGGPKIHQNVMLVRKVVGGFFSRGVFFEKGVLWTPIFDLLRNPSIFYRSDKKIALKIIMQWSECLENPPPKNTYDLSNEHHIQKLFVSFFFIDWHISTHYFFRRNQDRLIPKTSHEYADVLFGLRDMGDDLKTS